MARLCTGVLLWISMLNGIHAAAVVKHLTRGKRMSRQTVLVGINVPKDIENDLTHTFNSEEKNGKSTWTFSLTDEKGKRQEKEGQGIIVQDDSNHDGIFVTLPIEPDNEATEEEEEYILPSQQPQFDQPHNVLDKSTIPTIFIDSEQPPQPSMVEESSEKEEEEEWTKENRDDDGENTDVDVLLQIGNGEQPQNDAETQPSEEINGDIDDNDVTIFVDNPIWPLESREPEIEQSNDDPSSQQKDLDTPVIIVDAPPNFDSPFQIDNSDGNSLQQSNLTITLTASLEDIPEEPQTIETPQPSPILDEQSQIWVQVPMTISSLSESNFTTSLDLSIRVFCAQSTNTDSDEWILVNITSSELDDLRRSIVTGSWDIVYHVQVFENRLDLFLTNMRNVIETRQLEEHVQNETIHDQISIAFTEAPTPNVEVGQRITISNPQQTSSGSKEDNGEKGEDAEKPNPSNRKLFIILGTGFGVAALAVLALAGYVHYKKKDREKGHVLDGIPGIPTTISSFQSIGSESSRYRTGAPVRPREVVHNQSRIIDWQMEQVDPPTNNVTRQEERPQSPHMR